MKGSTWLPMYDAILREGWGRRSRIELAQELGRTQAAVQARANRLGISSRERPVYKNGTGRANLWLEPDIQYLRDHWKTTPLAEIAATLKRGVQATEAFGYHLGLGSKFGSNRWTEQDDAILRAGVAARLSLRIIAARVNRTINAVELRCGHLQLSRIPRRVIKPRAKAAEWPAVVRLVTTRAEAIASPTFDRGPPDVPTRRGRPGQRTCMWVDGERGNLRCCEEPATRGSWCEPHALLAVYRPEPRTSQCETT